MKVFVTWAGGRSHRAVQGLADWLNRLFPDVDAWLSPQIQKGDAWFDAIHRSLDAANLGIACVTADAIFRSDWLHYEVGYLRGRKVQVKPFVP